MDWYFTCEWHEADATATNAIVCTGYFAGDGRWWAIRGRSPTNRDAGAGEGGGEE